MATTVTAVSQYVNTVSETVVVMIEGGDNISVPIGMGLNSNSEDLILYFESGEVGMVSCPTRVMYEVDFPLFTGWTRVIMCQSLSELESKAAYALANGIPYEVLGYGLETSSPPEEYEDPLAATQSARTIANTYGKLLMMAPGYQLMSENEELYDDMSALSDIWMFQSQAAQHLYPPGEDYRTECARVIGLIQAGHADIDIWAQIIYPPAEEPSALDWVDYCMSIADLIEGAYLGVYIWGTGYDYEILWESTYIFCLRNY